MIFDVMMIMKDQKQIMKTNDRKTKLFKDCAKGVFVIVFRLCEVVTQFFRQSSLLHSINHVLASFAALQIEYDLPSFNFQRNPSRELKPISRNSI